MEESDNRDSHPVSVSGDNIILQVGETRFITTATTLGESGYFCARLSDRWPRPSEGSYFLDADPVLFNHVLRYLRHGVYPIFFDKLKGHDYGSYCAVLELATFLDIPNLVKWLEEKVYIDAVSTEFSIETAEGSDAYGCRKKRSNTEVEYHPAWRTQKVYVCPRNIFCHRGKPWQCGKDCRKAQGDFEAQYENEATLTTVVVLKEIIFNDELCNRRGWPPTSPLRLAG